MKIDNFHIGEGQPTFIIAEAGVNHNGNIDLAKQLVDAAVVAGADAIKFQTFKAEHLVSQDAETCTYQKRNTGRNESQFSLLKRLELSYDDHIVLLKYCKKKNILFLSTPFDEESAEFLFSLDVPAFKISSGDFNNFPFLKKVASYQKPMILSTGMSDLSEIKEIIKLLKSCTSDIAVLHCTTDYPCSFSDVHLRAMKTIEKACKLPVGYSDHTPGIEVSLAAVALGAHIIEKHFTLDKTLDGPDHKASLEPSELQNMVQGIRNIEQALGSADKSVPECAQQYMEAIKKSIIARINISQGSILSEEMLVVKRPGKGIEPKYFSSVVGSVARRDIKKDECIHWEDIQGKSKKPR